MAIARILDLGQAERVPAAGDAFIFTGGGE
jgi:hypothetical protein